MVDAVETMAWKGETPWHGLGHKVDGNLSPKEMLKQAKIDWTVSLRKLTAQGFSRETTLDVKDFSALVRDSDESVLDVVGSRWKPTQNEEAFEFFNEFVHAGDAVMETAGSLRGGRMVWGLANLKREFALAKGKDKVKGFLLVALPHEQGKSIRALLTQVRVVCWNTLTMALREGAGEGFRMSHRRVFDEVERERAKHMLGLAREDFDKQEEVAKKLATTTLTRTDSLRFLAELIEPSLLKHSDLEDLIGSGKVPKNLRLCALALDKGPGSQLDSAQGTLWGAVNAVTFATDHLFGQGQDQRLTKAWFGTSANLKNEAVRLALKKSGK